MRKVIGVNIRVDDGKGVGGGNTSSEFRNGVHLTWDGLLIT